jgi:class 3 adenylate cyclase
MGQTATIVVTDLVGSTQLRSEVGEDAADELRADHDARLADVALGHGGTVVKGTGDGLIVAFAGAAEALHACVALQQALHQLGRRRGLPLQMRIGVSAGDVTFEGGDCFGSPVIEAARLCAAAAPAEVLVADLVALLARGRGGLELRDPRTLELKGLPGLVTVHVLAWEPAAPGAIEVGAATPYVGRQRELDQLDAAFAGSSAGPGRTVLIAGEPGIGKTRLVEEFCRRTVQPTGAVVLTGGCHDGDVVANAPFVEALTRWGRSMPPDHLRDLLGPEAPVLVRLAPALAALLPSVGEPLPVPPEAESARLRDSVGQVLLRLAEQGPVVVVVDDLHWADAATVALLRSVARDARRGRILVIGTYRDTDLDRRHPFAEALGELQREVEPLRLALSGLEASAVQDLLGQLAEQDVTAAFAERLAAETEGNPFFLRETLLHLVEEGGLHHDGDTWVLEGEPGRIGVPAGVRDVIGRRLSRLSDDANRLLAIGALCEVSFSLPVGAAVAGMEEDVALDALDRAIAAQIVQPTSVFDEYRFTHALFRHVLVEEMNPSRQVRAHRALAEATEARMTGPPTPAQRAALLRHYECSAALPGAERGVEHALAVADDAARSFAPAEEHDAVARALELLADGDERRLDLVERHARSSLFAGVGQDAVLRSVTRAVDEVREHRGVDAACDLVAGLVMDGFYIGDVAIPWAIARLGVPLLRPDRRDGQAVVLTYARLAEADHLDPTHPGIPRDTPERQALNELMLSVAPEELGPLYVFLGSRAEADAFVDRVSKDAVDQHGMPATALNALWPAGRPREFADECRRVAEAASARGWVLPVVTTSAALARALCVLGEHEESDAAMALALGLLDRIPETSNGAFQAVGSEMLRKSIRGSEPTSEELGALLPFVELPDTSWAGLAVRAAYARTLSIEGRFDEAMAAVEPVVEVVDLAAGWAQNYPLILAHAIGTLWLAERTDGLDVLERNLRSKVVDPDVRYLECDGRWSLAQVCGLTGRVDEARGWFQRAREVMADQGTQPLEVGIDLDEVLLEQRLGTAGSRARIEELLDRARAGSAHPAMAAWQPRIDAIAAGR